jgi:hypothetical protein
MKAISIREIKTSLLNKVMKSLLKITLCVLSLMLLEILFTSCGKSTKPDGKVTVEMTDAPAIYSAVNVEVTGVSINSTNNGWVTLPVNAGVYNLLQLQNDVTVVLANSASVPVGKVTQLRLHLGDNNSVVTTAGTFNLKAPSGDDSGLKINLNETIFSNSNLKIVLDFDAGASVVETGSGEFVLKPVLKLDYVSQ